MYCSSENQIDGLVEYYSNSIANALELLQSCTEPSKYFLKVTTVPLKTACEGMYQFPYAANTVLDNRNMSQFILTKSIQAHVIVL